LLILFNFNVIWMLILFNVEVVSVLFNFDIVFTLRCFPSLEECKFIFSYPWNDEVTFYVEYDFVLFSMRNVKMRKDLMRV